MLLNCSACHCIEQEEVVSFVLSLIEVSVTPLIGLKEPTISHLSFLRGEIVIFDILEIIDDAPEDTVGLLLLLFYFKAFQILEKVLVLNKEKKSGGFSPFEANRILWLLH